MSIIVMSLVPIKEKKLISVLVLNEFQRHHTIRYTFLVTSLKMLQSDWLFKCKDIVIMTLRGAKTIFLDTWYATIEKT